MLGHNAPIDASIFPITPFDLEFLECSPVRKVFGVFDGACTFEATFIVTEGDVKVRCQYYKLLSLGMSRMLDTKTISDGECIVYGEKGILLTNIGHYLGPF